MQSKLSVFMHSQSVSCTIRDPLKQIDNYFFIKRYLVLLPILALGAYIIVTHPGCTGIQLVGAGLVGFYWQQLAFLGHDAGHRSHIAERGELMQLARFLVLYPS